MTSLSLLLAQNAAKAYDGEMPEHLLRAFILDDHHTVGKFLEAECATNALDHVSLLPFEKVRALDRRRTSFLALRLKYLLELRRARQLHTAAA